jgi:co-chaperonin GroES (HSP10)
MAFLTAAALPGAPSRCAAPSKCAVRAVVPARVNAADARPVRDRVLVRVLQNESVTAGDLLLASDSSTRPKMGVIVGIPPDENKATGDDFNIGDTVLWRHDYVAEVVQDKLDEDGGRIVSMRIGNISAKW